VTRRIRSAIGFSHGLLAIDQPSRARAEPRPGDGRTDRYQGDCRRPREACAGTSTEQELRTALAKRLKAALAEGRTKAEQLLLKDRQGRRCAERLCRMEDEIIRFSTSS